MVLPEPSDLCVDPYVVARRPDSVRSVYQPIVALGARRELVGFEALARWPAAPMVDPVAVFEAARAEGRVAVLDRQPLGLPPVQLLAGVDLAPSHTSPDESPGRANGPDAALQNRVGLERPDVDAVRLEVHPRGGGELQFVRTQDTHPPLAAPGVGMGHAAKVQPKRPLASVLQQ